MRKTLLIAWFSLVIMLASSESQAQLVLRMSRTFGYSSGSGDIQGAFTLKASGPEDLVRVDFMIDRQPLGEDGEAPFNLAFSTDSYALGLHSLTATGYTAGGQALHSNEIRANFVAAGEGMKAAGKILLPVLVIVGAAMLISFVIPLAASRGKLAGLEPGAARNYSLFGGAICPKCRRPFGLHLYGINLITGKLDRCPYCGRWSLVRRLSLLDLRAAEAAELEQAQDSGVAALSEAERLKKDLDNSRFENM